MIVAFFAFSKLHLDFGKFVKYCPSDPALAGEKSFLPQPRCFDRVHPECIEGLSMTPLHVTIQIFAKVQLHFGAYFFDPGRSNRFWAFDGLTQTAAENELR
jgi:hypothetical protein